MRRAILLAGLLPLAACATTSELPVVPTTPAASVQARGETAAVATANADAAAQYRAGSPKTFGFLVGQVMKASGGKANPKLANQILKRELENS